MEEAHQGPHSYEVMHTKTTKMWGSFCDCVTFYLQKVSQYDTGKALKYYITNMLKMPNCANFCQSGTA